MNKLEEIVKFCKGMVRLEANPHREFIATTHLSQWWKENKDLPLWIYEHENMEKYIYNTEIDFYIIYAYHSNANGFFFIYGDSLDEVCNETLKFLKEE